MHDVPMELQSAALVAAATVIASRINARQATPTDDEPSVALQIVELSHQILTELEKL